VVKMLLVNYFEEVYNFSLHISSISIINTVAIYKMKN